MGKVVDRLRSGKQVMRDCLAHAALKHMLLNNDQVAGATQVSKEFDRRRRHRQLSKQPHGWPEGTIERGDNVHDASNNGTRNEHRRPFTLNKAPPGRVGRRGKPLWQF